MTSSYEQAEKWASLTTKRRGVGTDIISVYEFDERYTQTLNILRFEAATKEWLQYVSANRKNDMVNDAYDMVIGPVANDKTMPVISLYFAGLYSEDEAISV